MALQLGALRDALIDAGAAPDKADRAAEELAGYDHEFAGLRSDMMAGFSRVYQEIAVVKGDIKLLRWMVGGIYLAGIPAAWLLIRMAFKLGAVG